ncbi:MAG: hypothetical protein KDA44_10680 [Planctomycetales bacterium]|nr:hypothetical protein [Planctomycetales bacterium]
MSGVFLRRERSLRTAALRGELRLTVHVGRKRGLPAFSSQSASCSLEWEAPVALLQSPAALRRQFAAAFARCRPAVAEELARPPAAEEPITPAQCQAVQTLVCRRRLDLRLVLEEHFGGRPLEDLSQAEAGELIGVLQTGSPTATSAALRARFGPAG